MVAVLQPRPVPVAVPVCRSAPVSELTYRRRRAAAAGVLVALLVAVQGVVGVVAGGTAGRSQTAITADRFSAYVVQPGDTFWSIARRLDPGGDPRPLVDRLVAEHGSAVLHVGERIALPERR